MTPVATVLLVEDDAKTLRAFRELLRRHGGFRVETATNGREGWEEAQRLVPDLIVSDLEMPEVDGFELCRLVKGSPATAASMFVVLTAHADTALKVAGLNLGVDDYLTKPLEASELIAKVRATLRIKALHDEIRADRATLATLHAELAGSFDHLLALLVHLLDLRVPGAALRGQRLAVAAVRLAVRFEMPEEYRRDLELGAMLHEIGRIADTAPEDSAVERGLEPEVSGGDWRYTVASAAILSGIERLRPVAELVGCISENWDGTGFPGHMRQGQIPLRSRILRVLADFSAEVERTSPGVTPRQSAAHLASRGGTWYDPMVVSQLEALVQESPDWEWRASHRRISIAELEAGMRLADDLLTSSGTKLLSAGATLTGSSLEAIRRRHLSDPVVYGVLVDQ